MTINDLIKTAKAATANGDSIERRDRDSGDIDYIVYSQNGDFATCSEFTDMNAKNNAKHIAQFSPATIIPILEELAAARAYVFGDFPETGTDVILEIAKQRCDKYREARAKTDKALGI